MKKTMMQTRLEIVTAFSVTPSKKSAYLQSQRNGHVSLCHGVHWRAEKWSLDLDVARHLGLQHDIGGAKVDVAGQENDVIVCEALTAIEKSLRVKT
jgi:hypothetical protein